MALSRAKVLVQCVLLAICLVALVGRGRAMTLCKVDSDKLGICLPAVTGKSPPPPSENCCSIIKQADLPCLCSYKEVLRAFKIDPASAVELPEKCGLKKPRECQG